MNHTLLNQLCDTLGVRLLHDDEDSVALDFGDDLVVFLTHDTTQPVEAGLLLYARIGDLPVERTEVLEELLEANLMGVQTEGATLSLERYSRAVLVHLRSSLPSMATAADLQKVVRQFTDTVERWKLVLTRLLQADEALSVHTDVNHFSQRV